MADQEPDAEDKQYEASERKLAQARDGGDIPRSEDMQMAASLAGFVLVFIASGGWLMGSAGDAGLVFFDQADRLSGMMHDEFWLEVERYSVLMLLPALLLLAGPTIGVLVYLTISRAWLFSPNKLLPKASRVSVLGNAKQKFGKAGIVEFLKKLLKLGAVSSLLTLILNLGLEEIMTSANLEAGLVASLIGKHLSQFLLSFLMISTVFGVMDLLWQRYEFNKRNRMTRQEMVDEFKESEGDPHLKADRRRRAQEIATNRMLMEVPKADVIIVNPTHFAVALKWKRGSDAAPRCVAKGVDEIAARIRSLALEHGVPIHPDPPTARAIFAAVQVGQEIRVEHYAAVAVAVRFADRMRRRAQLR